MFVDLLMLQCDAVVATMRPRVARWLGLMLVFLCGGWWSHHAAAASPCAGCERPLDSVWLVSTRQSPCDITCDGAESTLRFYRYESYDGGAAGQWQSRDEASFFAADPPGGMTIFFVHGNRVSSTEAFRRGLAAYRGLVRHAQDDHPVRFVIWSWPAAAVKGFARDVRIKAYRAGPAGYRLAWLVSRLDPDEPVGMIGFSFGARVITGSLHALGGGQVGRCELPAPVERMPVRAVLLTAAVDRDWLVPGHCHGLALMSVDRVLLMNNSCDRALKWYPLIDRRRRPQALGRDGIALCTLGGAAAKVVQRDVCCQIGRVHDIRNYLCAPSLMAQVWAFVRAVAAEGATDQHLVMDRTVD